MSITSHPPDFYTISLEFRRSGKIDMLKNILGALAAIALVVALILLILQSRSVDETYYAEHVIRLNQLELIEYDSASVLQSLRSAHDSARPVPESVDTGIRRLKESAAAFRRSVDRAQLDVELVAPITGYEDAVKRFVSQSEMVAQRQTSLFELLAKLQAESPAAVNDLRGLTLEAQAQQAFAVTLEVFDVVAGKSTVGATDLRNRLDALRTDPAINTRATARLDPLVYLAERVLEAHESATTAMLAIDRSALQSANQRLSSALQSANRERVDGADRASFMLSVFSVLLLAGVALIAWRLHQSYRALNRSNESLEEVNNSLEARVVERTVELSSAYEELQESQVQLVQAEKMSSLGSLVAGISHEINTPLWYLISNSTTIRERLQTAKALVTTATTMVSAVKRREDVSAAMNQGIRSMHQLVKDGIEEDIDEANDLIEDSIQGLNDLTEMAQSLKDFSRLDRAPVGEFDVNEGIEKTLKIVKNKIKERIEVVKNFGELPPMTCSPSQINQVFLNLISNAADAIDGDGAITITTSRSNDRIMVQVADTGCGIPDDVMSKVRDPFFTTKDVGQGTGLGLSIVERIVTSHDGELRIDSTVGEGSVFTVDLPIGTTANDEAVSIEDTVVIEAPVFPAPTHDVDGENAPALSPA